MTKRIVRGMGADGKIVETEIEINPAQEEENEKRRLARQAAREKMKQPASEAALGNPELMRVWGEIHSAWDDIEHLLWVAFDSLLEDDPEVTRIVFFTQKSHAARRDMVAALIKHHFRWNAKVHKSWKNVLKRIEASSGRRNDLMHGGWGWFRHAHISLEVIRVVTEGDVFAETHKGYKRKLRYRKKDLVDVANQMRETKNELLTVLGPIRHAKAIHLQAKFKARFHEMHKLIKSSEM